MTITIRNTVNGRVIAHGVSANGGTWKQDLLRLYHKALDSGSPNREIGAIMAPGMDDSLASDTWLVTLVSRSRSGAILLEDVIVETDPPQR